MSLLAGRRTILHSRPGEGNAGLVLYVQSMSLSIQNTDFKCQLSVYHGSYAGDDVVSNDLLETYARSLSKPGFLRAGMQVSGSRDRPQDD